MKRILLCEENKAFTESFRTFKAMLQQLCSLRSMGKSIPRQSLRWLSSSSVPPPTPAIPPGLLQYLEKKEQEESFGRSQNQLANLHSALRRYTRVVWKTLYIFHVNVFQNYLSSKIICQTSEYDSWMHVRFFKIKICSVQLCGRA